MIRWVPLVQALLTTRSGRLLQVIVSQGNWPRSCVSQFLCQPVCERHKVCLGAASSLAKPPCQVGNKHTLKELITALAASLLSYAAASRTVSALQQQRVRRPRLQRSKHDLMTRDVLQVWKVWWASRATPRWRKL
jgi:hypothetical protein